MNEFSVPYFITNHAVEQFREYVESLSAAEIIVILQRRLQQPGQPVQWEIRDGMMVPIFMSIHDGKAYYIPVVTGRGKWPAVPTILGENSALHQALFFKKNAYKEVIVCEK